MNEGRSATPLLAGTRVLDFGRLLPSGVATFQLAALGADVVKVERPPHGDYLRTNPPTIGGRGDMHLDINRNKRSIALDFTTSQGRSTALRMAEKADIVVESSRPGAFTKFGLDYESIRAVNPRAIYASFSGFGQFGAYSALPAHGLSADAFGSLLSASTAASGLPDSYTSAGAWAAGMHGACVMIAALVRRRTSDGGHYIDIAQSDAAMSFMFRDIDLEINNVSDKAGSFRELGPRYDVYECADRRLVLLTATESKLWNSFCAAINRPDLRAPLGSPDVLAYGRDDALRAEIGTVFATRPRQFWITLAVEHGLGLSPVNTVSDLSEEPQARDRQMVRDERHPLGGRVRLTGYPVALDGAFPDLRPAPELGEHGADVLADYGFTPSDIDEILTWSC